MKIHEYQSKELLRQFNVPVPNGIPAFSVNEAVKAEKLGGPVWVVKAQIHAGGRGKGGGVKLAKSMDEVKKYASEILGMQLKTHQTGPKVNRLLIEGGADIKKEYYFSIVTDRGTQNNVIMASSKGGIDIEEVAETHPETIIKVFVDPLIGLTDADCDIVAKGIGVPEASIPMAHDVFKNLYKTYWDTDASLFEINLPSSTLIQMHCSAIQVLLLTVISTKKMLLKFDLAYISLDVPLFERMKGTNEELGKKILADSGLPIISADSMAEAATKVVAAVAKSK